MSKPQVSVASHNLDVLFLHFLQVQHTFAQQMYLATLRLHVRVVSFQTAQK